MKKVRLLLLILFSTSFAFSNSTLSYSLGPLDMVFTGFDKQINPFGGELFRTKNIETIPPGTEWSLTNARYDGDTSSDLWDISNADFRLINLRFVGSVSISSFSTITYISDPANTQPFLIKVNGIDRTSDFLITNNSNSNPSSSLFNSENEIYIIQGRFYSSNQGIKLMGTVVDMIKLGINNNPPLDIAFKEGDIGGDQNSGTGSFDEEFCDCDDREEASGSHRWSYKTGTVNTDIEEDPDDECPCEGTLVIQEINCVYTVDLNATDFVCDSIDYAWVSVNPNNDDETTLYFGSTSSLNTILYHSSNSAYIKLVITCRGECTIESDTLFADCGDIICPPVVTEILGDCTITVNVTECSSQQEIYWFEVVGNIEIPRPDLDGSYFLNFENSSCYKYELVCNGCDIIKSEVHCFSDCEEGNECDYDITISSENVTVDLYDYCLPIPTGCSVVLGEIEVELPNGIDVFLFDDPIFANSYCLMENQCEGEGSESQNPCNFGDDDPWHLVTIHINEWLQENGYYGQAAWIANDDPTHPCFNNGFEFILVITGTNVVFESAFFWLNNNTPLDVKFEQYNYNEFIEGVTYSLNNVCPGAAISWNNGSTSTSSTYDYGESFEVYVLCPDGCEYTFNCPPEDMYITEFVETEELCDYCVKTNYHCPSGLPWVYFDDIEVELPDGTIINLTSEPEFDFPYCNDGQGSGVCATQCPTCGDMYDLAQDINDWFNANPEFQGNATYIPHDQSNPQIACNDNRSPLLVIEESNVVFNFNDLSNNTSCTTDYTEYNCQNVPTGNYELTLNNPPCPGASYQWSSGGTTQTVELSSPGNYTVTVTCGECNYVVTYKIDDATSIMSVPLVEHMLTSIDDNESEEESTILLSDDVSLTDYGIKVYPNPSSTFFNIEFNATEIISGELQIYDLRGQKLFMTAFKDKDKYHFKIDVHDYPPGIYLVKVLTPGDPFPTQKAIIIK